MKRLNLKLAIGLVLALTTVIVGFVFLHHFQVDRNAGNWLVDARESVAAENPLEAEAAYRRYLDLRPGDGEAWREYVDVCRTIFEKQPSDSSQRNYYRACERAVGFFPDDFELHEQFLELTITVRPPQIQIAEQQIKELRRLKKLTPKSVNIEAEILLVKGNAESAQEKYAEIVGLDLTTGKIDPAAADACREYKAYYQLALLLAATPSNIPLARTLVEDLAQRHAERFERNSRSIGCGRNPAR
ncbi:MAG: hypothetical protein QM811_24545 [Pirellulales bacterium]